MPAPYDAWLTHRMPFPPPKTPAPNEPTEAPTESQNPPREWRACSPEAEAPAPNEPTATPTEPGPQDPPPQKTPAPNEPKPIVVRASLPAAPPAEAPAPNEAKSPPESGNPQHIDIKTLTPETLDEITRSFPSGGGVYLLTDADDRYVQLASAGNLRRALRVRLLEPELAEAEKGRDTSEKSDTPDAARKRARLAEIVRTIRWTPATSQFEITWRYYQIARALLPDDYREHIAFGLTWFVAVAPDAAFPRFETHRTLRYGHRHLGPFATRNEANRFIQILEDAFDLCRYYDILQQAPRGEACAYYEMGKCPAPCDGSIPMEQYRTMIGNAWTFAAGDRRPHFDALERRMKQAAADLAFERAAAIKQTLERARGVEHHAYRHVQPLEDFHYLILQRGSTASRVKPFFVQPGRIDAGDEVLHKQIEATWEQWVGRMSTQSRATDTTDPRETSELIALVAHFLHRKDTPGVYLHARELADTKPCLERIEQALVRRRPPRQKPGEPRDTGEPQDSGEHADEP